MSAPVAGAVAVRVGRSEVVGAHGQQYAAGAFGLRPVGHDTVLFGEGPAVRWTIGSQLIRALYDCSFVSLGEILAAHS
ncbi:hypothetical protein KJK32_16920 [Streptomyces sp. JCM17656]|nr:hypothetical protein KJK32_16920 [Streptomyces sp. JCM17656]